MVNPAFAGQQKNAEIIVNSKMQWVGIKDAPNEPEDLRLEFLSGDLVAINEKK